MVGYVGVDLNDYQKSSECFNKKVSFLPGLEENNNNDNGIERLPSEFSNRRMGTVSQKLAAQQQMSKNSGENNFGNRNNSYSYSGIRKIPPPEGQTSAKLMAMAAKRNGTRSRSRYRAFFDPRSDLPESSTERLDLFLDKYEEDHGFEPVDMDLVGIEIMPKIAALEELLSREKKCSMMATEEEDYYGGTIEDDLLEKIISNSLPFSSLGLSNPTAETVIGKDEGDNNGKVNSKSQPLTQIKDEESRKIPQKPVIRLAPSPTVTTAGRHEKKGSVTSKNFFPHSLKNNNNNEDDHDDQISLRFFTDKTLLLLLSNDTSKVQTVQNIDTQQKKQVDNTEVAGNNKNKLSCDKKTSENANNATAPTAASIVITSPQKRPPPQHIDNSLRRDATFTRENYGGAAAEGNRREFRIYDEIVKNPNPPGKFQNNQNQSSHSQGKKITSASASQQQTQQRPPPSGPGFAKDKKIDSQQQQNANKTTTWPTPTSPKKSINSKEAIHAKSYKSKIPVLLPKTRENASLSSSLSCSKEEGKSFAKQKDVNLLWKPPVKLPTIYEADSTGKSDIPLRTDNNNNANMQKQVQHVPKANIAKAEVDLNHRDQNGNNSIRLKPPAPEQNMNRRFLFRISEAPEQQSSLPVPMAIMPKAVVPFKTATSPARHLQNKTDEVSSCLDLIEGLSRHTTWVMKKVLEYPITDQAASERVKQLKECPEIGEFFGFPYVNNELLGQFYISRLRTNLNRSRFSLK